MADEHIRVPSSQSPAAAAPASPLTATAPVTANGETHTPAPLPSPAVPPRGLRRLGTTLWELVWPPTGNHVAQSDSIREVVETVVFVVVLVLLLKSFAAEAFVIPTGSMAETLWGYQRVVTCPQCEYQFPVNCSSEVDPQEGGAHATITGCTCPNCRFHVDLDRDRNKFLPNSGDRVLVAKSLYELGLMHPERRDVVVFKFPGDSPEPWPTSGPQKNYVPMNYIKRLIGLGGETIGIWYGKLYVSTEDTPNDDDLRADPLVLWRHSHRADIADHMHEDKLKDKLERLFEDPPEKRTFHILRKRPDKILALRRLVYDNDHQAKDLAAVPRWVAEQSSAWTADKDNGFSRAGGEARGIAWLRYHHLLVPRPKPSEGNPGAVKPQLITDFMGYNAFDSVGAAGGHGAPPQNWVGDLILECDVTPDGTSGDVVLELSKGVDRFRARWDLGAGTCTVVRVEDGKEKELEKHPSVLRPGSSHRLRFANVDDRLTVWVDGGLPFGDGVDYEPSHKLGPTKENDLEPASIGAAGGVRVHHLKLWRDTYYTLHAGSGSSDAGLVGSAWAADPEQWVPLQHLPAKTLFVQPGHYLCLGDNSPESSDGRTWGTVPERLLLGRALLVYYPFKGYVWPLNSPVNRVGPIR
jgi:signal peptidase I